MAKFRSDGHEVNYTPVADVVAGQLVKYGNFVGVANNDIAANKRGSLRMDGVFSIPLSIGAMSGAQAFGLKLDIIISTQKFAADGAGDANIDVYLAEPIATPVDATEYQLFLNHFGG